MALERRARGGQSPSKSRRRTQRGGVFVIALAVTAGLVAVLASIAASQRVANLATANRIQARRADIAAFSAVQRALAEFATQDTAVTTYQDPWAILSIQGQERFVVGRNEFRLEIVDSSGFVNINTADEDQLLNLPFTQEQIDSLLDWREGARDPRTQGAKDEYYNNLFVPYNAKLGPFESLDELLLVRGFTPSSLYEVQEDTVNTSTIVSGSSDAQPVLAELLGVVSQTLNVTQTGETKLNVNSNQVSIGALVQRGISQAVAAAIVQARQRRRFANLGEVVTLAGPNPADATAILDNLTTSSAQQAAGKINVNTASESVLTSLPGMQPDVAQAIVARQNTGFLSMGELLTVPGYAQQVLQQTVDRLTTNSQSFLVRIEGRAGAARRLLEATIILEEGVPRVTQIRRPPFADMPQRWGWADEPIHDVIITEIQ